MLCVTARRMAHLSATAAVRGRCSLMAMPGTKDYGALSVLVQGAGVVTVWLIGRALGLPVPLLYYGILVPLVALLTMLPVSLNGMGVREGGMVLFLTPLGISSATALSLAFLWFSVFVAGSLFGAGIYLFGNLSRPGEPPHDSFVGRDSDQGRARQSQAAA